MWVNAVLVVNCFSKLYACSLDDSVLLRLFQFSTFHTSIVIPPNDRARVSIWGSTRGEKLSQSSCIHYSRAIGPSRLRLSRTSCMYPLKVTVLLPAPSSRVTMMSLLHRHSGRA
ncbi:hypothetical protein BDV36DRAFT_153694 [Aspergillus pseudocaelatus]|uniref:Secreted protein n=1 Tax=Aspergillus pseudocaelatus TaxID=1825620 RepID=A0ABQ6WSQ3_9EURO|nr:hypothetical protein BDV36DRAFT_153694 [Aspergillus pseudocaelatus]